MNAMWKATKADGHPAHGYGRWHRRRWRTVSGDLVPCRRGIHYAAGPQILEWLDTELWAFEDGAPDDAIDAGDKMVTRRGRVLERVQTWTPAVAQELAYYAADRAVRVHAVAALRAAGLPERAAGLAALAPVVDADSAAAARDAARAASYAASTAGDAALAARYAASAASDAAGAARYAAWAARYAAGAASYAASTAGEREHLYEWLLTRLGWTP